VNSIRFCGIVRRYEMPRLSEVIGRRSHVAEMEMEMSKSRHKVASSPSSTYRKVNPSTSFRPGQLLHPQMACEQSCHAT
jgi:hypothetical protein